MKLKISGGAIAQDGRRGAAILAQEL